MEYLKVVHIVCSSKEEFFDIDMTQFCRILFRLQVISGILVINTLVDEYDSTIYSSTI